MKCNKQTTHIYFQNDTGPNTNSVEMITQLRNAGLNVVRMNFSHGTYEVCLFLHDCAKTIICRGINKPFLI